MPVAPAMPKPVSAHSPACASWATRSSRRLPRRPRSCESGDEVRLKPDTTRTVVVSGFSRTSRGQFVVSGFSRTSPCRLRWWQYIRAECLHDRIDGLLAANRPGRKIGQQIHLQRLQLDDIRPVLTEGLVIREVLQVFGLLRAMRRIGRLQPGFDLIG